MLDFGWDLQAAKRGEELQRKVDEVVKNPVLKTINELTLEINSSVISSWLKVLNS